MATGQMEVTARMYAYELSNKDFMAIEHRDDEQDTWDDTLAAKLDKLDGVDDVDYNGHFGAFIYFRIDDKHDSESLRKYISNMINNYAGW